MASIDQLADWEQKLTQIDALYREVEQTTSATQELISDLSGSTAKGNPPPMPGGDRVASVAVFNEHAPADPERFPHPLMFLHHWSWHVAAATGGLPPRRAWQPALDYLMAHLQWIDGADAEDFAHEMFRVHGNLRRLCKVDRRSQAEEVWIGKQNEKQAREQIRALVERDAIPEWLPPRNGRRYRTPFMVTREEGASIYPELAEPPFDDFYGIDPDEKDRVDEAWNRVSARSRVWAARNDEMRKAGLYKLEYVRDEARKITVA